MVVLEKRELENYLVSPKALTEFIRIKLQIGGVADKAPPTSVEVEAAISAAAEELQQVAIERRVARIVCKPIYLNRKKLLEPTVGKTFVERASEEITANRSKVEGLEQKLPDIIAQQEQAVKQVWEAKKADIVPGDLLLDSVWSKIWCSLQKRKGRGKIGGINEYQ